MGCIGMEIEERMGCGGSGGKRGKRNVRRRRMDVLSL